MRTIGLIVNPIGGIGGRVDLKGADGEMHEKTLAMDTETVSPARVQEFLSHVSCSDKIRLLVVPCPRSSEYRTWRSRGL